MKLGGVFEGTLYGTEYRTVVVESARAGFDKVGQLPVPSGGLTAVWYRVKTGKPLKSLIERYVGRFATVNVWQVSRSTFVATANRWLFVSEDGGVTWRTSLELPRSSGPMGVLPSGFCCSGETWYVGEYPLDTDVTPRVRQSTDGGRSWTTRCSLPDVRHVHSVQRDPYTGEIWITTGDVEHGCAIGRLRDGEFIRMGSGSQRWRAVELAFTPSAVLWGMDSVYKVENPIMGVERDEVDSDTPTVETLCTLDSSVYYATTLQTGHTDWVVFSTAMEPGTDSTAPGGQQDESHSGRARVVAASAESGYTHWYELASFEKRSVPADRLPTKGFAPPANAYVFLDSDPERGVFVNPHNTAGHDGSVLTYPPAYFEALRQGSNGRARLTYVP